MIEFRPYHFLWTNTSHVVAKPKAESENRAFSLEQNAKARPPTQPGADRKIGLSFGACVKRAAVVQTTPLPGLSFAAVPLLQPSFATATA
jgi:hypothetical protein